MKVTAGIMSALAIGSSALASSFQLEEPGRTQPALSPGVQTDGSEAASATLPLLGSAPIGIQEDESIPKFIITTVAGTGKLGMSGDDGPAVEARIQRPTAVALDSQGNLYIADEQNLRIRMVDPDGIIITYMGTTSAAPQKVDQYAFDTNLSSAYGIATDKNDNLYVLSRGHAKIMKVGEDGLARRIVGTGVSGFSGDGGPAIDAQINFSNHLVVDEEGILFIADTGNNRIRKVSTDGIITTVAGTGAVGLRRRWRPRCGGPVGRALGNRYRRSRKPLRGRLSQPPHSKDLEGRDHHVDRRNRCVRIQRRREARLGVSDRRALWCSRRSWRIRLHRRPGEQPRSSGHARGHDAHGRRDRRARIHR